MLQMDDLRQVVTEIVEEVCTKRGLNEKPSVEEGEWLTESEWFFKAVLCLII